VGDERAAEHAAGDARDADSELNDRDEQPPRASHAARDAHCDIAMEQLFVRRIVVYITGISDERNEARSSTRRPPCTRETFAGKFTNT
jgi:hypothetical protein